jgi:hypothetical protein
MCLGCFAFLFGLWSLLWGPQKWLGGVGSIAFGLYSIGLGVRDYRRAARQTE